MIIITGFVNPNGELVFPAMKNSMKQPLIFDGRNQYDPQQVRAAEFDYFRIGR